MPSVLSATNVEQFLRAHTIPYYYFIITLILYGARIISNPLMETQRTDKLLTLLYEKSGNDAEHDTHLSA